jgi:hypothetical protein
MDAIAGSNMKTALEYKDKNHAEANHTVIISVPMSICGQFFSVAEFLFLGRNPDKSLKSLSRCCSQSPLQLCL